MARQMPSVLALLGLLAVAGYQNRDKLGELLNGVGGGAAGNGGDGQTPAQPGQTGQAGGLGGMLSGLAQTLGVGEGAGNVNEGLGGLLDSFRQSGQGDVADSWVRTDGENASLTPDGVAQALGEDTVGELTAKTGLSRDELLKRLATIIPEGVDKLTPNGSVPPPTGGSNPLRA